MLCFSDDDFCWNHNLNASFDVVSFWKLQWSNLVLPPPFNPNGTTCGQPRGLQPDSTPPNGTTRYGSVIIVDIIAQGHYIDAGHVGGRCQKRPLSPRQHHSTLANVRGEDEASAVGSTRTKIIDIEASSRQCAATDEAAGRGGPTTLRKRFLRESLDIDPSFTLMR